MTSLLMKIGLFVLAGVVLNAVCVSGSDRDGRLLKRSKRFIEYGPDIAGPYCETRRESCCPGRLDTCSVPILDTLCYCDMFCNRTRGDCCPDFFSFCFGQPQTTPPPFRGACTYGKTSYPPNSSIKKNCQKCTCSPDQQSATGYDWRCDGEVCLIRENIIDGVNDGRFGWRASNYSDFWGLTLRDGRKYRLGTHKPESIVQNMSPIKIQFDGTLPSSFDARTNWPGLIHDVRDQGNCGASWAFSTSALASDRLAIESKGRAVDSLSPQHLMSCNNHGQDGCNGGYLDRAWWFLRKRGVSTEDCYPYKSGQTNTAGRCEISRHQSGGRCPSGIAYQKERIFHSTPPYRIAPLETHIMAEIMMNGPVQATFKVKDDFFMYKSGVYKYSGVAPDSVYQTDDKRSYHSVRIVGWGVERGIGGRQQKYWICANSWGPYWGEGGYFRIARGTNECDIESFVLGVWGKVEGDPELARVLTSFQAERRRERFRTSNRRRRRRRHLKRKSKKHHKKNRN